MSHSLTKIWIHGVFSTKDRAVLIEDIFESKLHTHIKSSLENQFECGVKIINGTKDHVHILFLQNPNHSIKDIFHYIKGESSHWINQNNFLKQKFAWQIGYSAFSVSESNLEKIETYIKDQKEHHRKKSFAEEYELFIRKYNITDKSR